MWKLRDNDVQLQESEMKGSKKFDKMHRSLYIYSSAVFTQNLSGRILFQK